MKQTIQLTREALSGERKVNSFKKWGTLVSDPQFVLEAVTNGSASNLLGTHKQVTASDVDFLFQKAKNVTLAEQDDYYTSNDVKANVYHVVDDELVRSEFRREDDEWITYEAVENYGPIENDQQASSS